MTTATIVTASDTKYKIQNTEYSQLVIQVRKTTLGEEIISARDGRKSMDSRSGKAPAARTESRRGSYLLLFTGY